MGLVRAAVCFALAGWVSPAFAQDSVRWDAAVGCPSADEAKAQIAGLTAAPVDGAAEVPSAEVVIRREPSGEFEARITLGAGASAQLRVLRDVQCAALSHAAAVVVALASERAHKPATQPPSAADAKRTRGPAATSGRGLPRSSGARTATPSESAAQSDDAQGSVAAASADAGSLRAAEDIPAPAPPLEPEAHAQPIEPAADGGEHTDSQPVAAEPRADPPSVPVSVQVTFAGALSAGLVPRLAPLVAAGAGVTLGQARVALRFAYAPAQRANVPSPAGLGGSVGLTSIGLEGGLQRRFGAFELPLIAGLEAGLFNASSRGIPESDALASTTPWLAVRLGSGLSWWLSERVAIGLRLEGIVSLLRPHFALRGPDDALVEFHRPQLLSGRALFQTELRLP